MVPVHAKTPLESMLYVHAPFTHAEVRMWDMSVRSQIVYFGADLCGLSHSFLFPWKRT